MEAAIRIEYAPAVRAAVAAAVGVRPEALRDPGGFNSFVHEALVDGHERIVKATWGGRRSREEVGAELHFVTYLADGGAPVCRPVELAGGELQRSVASANGAFHVTCWEKAAGRSLSREELTPELFRPWGALIGRLHHLGAAYPGPPPPLARPSWRAEHEALAAFVADDPEMHARFVEMLDGLEALPKRAGTSGPMHTDLHHHNLFWHEGLPRAFDFEDMLDFWFVSDLAIVLFYAVLSPCKGRTIQERYDSFERPLWEGYATEHDLPPDMRAEMPRFLALREQVLRAVMLRSTPPDQLTPGACTFLGEATQRIRDRAPALGLRTGRASVAHRKFLAMKDVRRAGLGAIRPLPRPRVEGHESACLSAFRLPSSPPTAFVRFQERPSRGSAGLVRSCIRTSGAGH